MFMIGPISSFLMRKFGWRLLSGSDPVVEAPAEESSTHKAEVVCVKLEPHPNADSLSIVHVFNGGYQCVVRTADFNDGDLGVFIVPDSMVPEHPYFDFLRSSSGVFHARVTAHRFRKQLSEGLLIPIDDVVKNWGRNGMAVTEGQNLAPMIGITRYEPKSKYQEAAGRKIRGCDYQAEAGPALWYASPYHVESWQRYGAEIFADDDDVVMREKIDGTNFRACFYRGKFYVGSHRTWQREYLAPQGLWQRCLQRLGLSSPTLNQSIWRRIARLNPGIERLCRATPGAIVFGEVYSNPAAGAHPLATYGLEEGEAKLVIFDVRLGQEWLSDYELQTYSKVYDLELAPLVFGGKYSESLVRVHMSGPSLMGIRAGSAPPHSREGVVIRTFHGAGRKVLKAVSSEYLILTEGKK